MAAFEAELARCPIFLEMTPDECQEVLDLAEVTTFPAGETILHEGHSIQMLWIILRGRCEVVKSMENGQEQQLAVLERGGLFGEMSFFHPAPHSASVRALSEIQVMTLSREKYEQLEQSGLRAAYKIAASTARVLADRLRRMDEWAFDFVQRPDVGNHREEWREFRAKLYTDWQF